MSNNMKVLEIRMNLDKERHLRYDLNALEIIEEQFGTLEDAFKEMEQKRIKVLKVFLFAGLKHEDESLTLNQVGSFLNLSGLLEIKDIIVDAITDNLPKGDSEGEFIEEKK